MSTTAARHEARASHARPAFFYRIDLRGIRASAIAAWYAKDAMMTAFFIRSSGWIVSRKSRFGIGR